MNNETLDRSLKILEEHAQNTIAEDRLMFSEQILNHLAHVVMLYEQEIVSHEDAAAILSTLLQLLGEGSEEIPLKPGLTDLYSNVEEYLIDRLGIEVGGRMHTGRSRNDMNPAIERMFARRLILQVCEAIICLMDTLLTQAEAHKHTIIPAYTHHSQQAQPVTLGHFYMSAYENFARDMQRLLSAYDRVNLSPMGGAAVATTGFPINRERVCELLGFRGLLVNSMDACSTLDFAYEPACAMSIFINNVGRVAESLLLWNLNEVGISRLALPYCSYSTIMPQKRNPVALETLRYAGEWTYGALGTMFNTMKAYTPGNGREPGFVVSLFYEIAQRIEDSAYLLEGIIRTLEVDRERALQVTRDGFSTVTDLADEMVKSMGLSFSAAKKIVGRLVVTAQAEGIACTEIDTALVRRAAKEALNMDLDMPQELITNALDPVENVNRRAIIGGPSPVRVQQMIDAGEKELEGFRRRWHEEKERLAAVDAALVALAESIAEEAE